MGVRRRSSAKGAVQCECVCGCVGMGMGMGMEWDGMGWASIAWAKKGKSRPRLGTAEGELADYEPGLDWTGKARQGKVR